MGNIYRLGHTYRDTGTPNKDNDQFMRWLNIEGSRMLNSPGIRPLKFINIDYQNLPAYVVLVTARSSRSDIDNPWDDKVDYENAEIKHWGDAKFSESKKIDDWNGNKSVRNIYNNSINKNNNYLAVPFLHFSKPQKGEIVFNGLCILNNLELTWFWDPNKKKFQFRITRCI